MSIEFPGRPRLRSITFERPGLSAPYGVLDYLVRDDVLCWTRRETGLVGFGELTRFTSSGEDRFRLARQWWSDIAADAESDNPLNFPGTGPLAFGSFSFSWTSKHLSRLIVPEIVVGCDEGRSWLTYSTFDPAAELTADAAEARLADFLADVEPEAGPATGGNRLVPGAMDQTRFRSAVAAGVEQIKAGRLSKLVLARDAVAELAAPVSAAQVLRELALRYQDCWTYGVDGLVGSTPEMLIKVEGGRARARVLAGTLDRAGAPSGDPGYAARVLGGSEKQRHEHQIAIDSLTEQLGPLAASMTSHSEPFLLELPNVWHLASDVEAQLEADDGGRRPTSLDLAEALHPTAAVCGTPTKVAGALIRELEQLDRGPYAGPVGWIDTAGNGEWGIALRGAVIEAPDRVRLYAGCGIVAASDPEAELAETWTKLRPMMEALGVGRDGAQ